MSGGSWEYVMGNYNDVIANSGFINMPESKYYDKYIGNNISVGCNNEECLSHGLSETQGWDNDYDHVLNENYPWLIRGGSFANDVGTGIFSYSVTTEKGNSRSTISFRLVATIR